MPVDERLDLHVTADGTVDGRDVERTVDTHSAILWFVGDLVVKRKRPVDLDFLDFRTLAARQEACAREVALNRRLETDVHLGLVDVVDENRRADDEDGRPEVVDVAVVMRRLPDERRLSTLAEADPRVDDCVRRVARSVAAFHAGEPPSPRAHELAGPAAVRTNWEDNLDVLRDHPDLAPTERVARIADEVGTWLDGRTRLFERRIDEGMVRDGHGDLVADDVFCLDDGPRVIDCLDFADRFRIGDVALDVAFLAMDLERLGRPDLAGRFLEAHAEFLGERRHEPLLHHYVAYRAGVRAKVACLTDDPRPGDVQPYLELAQRHLDRARVRLVLVGGLPGTGKSTLARGVADRLAFAVLQSDEIRKDLLGRGHDEPAGAAGYAAEVTEATYAELLDRAGVLLGDGQSVVLDASWSDPANRRRASALAEATGAELHALVCRVPDDVARDRLRRRRDDVSDADVGVHEAMRDDFAPWPEAVVIPADAAPATVVDRATRAIGSPGDAANARTDDAVSSARRRGRSAPPG